MSIEAKILRALRFTNQEMQLPVANRGYAAFIFGIIQKRFNEELSKPSHFEETFYRVFLEHLHDFNAVGLINDAICKKHIQSVIINCISQLFQNRWHMIFLFNHVASKANILFQIGLVRAINYQVGMCSEISALLFYHLSQLKAFPIAFLYVASPKYVELGHCFLITGPNVNDHMTLEELKQNAGFVVDLWSGMVYQRKLLCMDIDHLAEYRSQKISIGARSLDDFKRATMPAEEKRCMDVLIDDLTKRCVSALKHESAIDLNYNFTKIAVEERADYCDQNDLRDTKRSENYENSMRNLSTTLIQRFWKKNSTRVERCATRKIPGCVF